MKKLSLYLLLMAGMTLSGAVLTSCDNGGKNCKPCKMQDCRPYRCRPCKKKCKPCNGRRSRRTQNY